MVGDFVETLLRNGATFERFSEVGLDGALLKLVQRGFESGAAATRGHHRGGEHLVTQAARDFAGAAIVVLGDDPMSFLMFDDARGTREGCPERDVQARGDRGGRDSSGARSAESGRTNDARFHLAREFVNAQAHFRRLERRHVGRRIRAVEGAANDVGRLNLNDHAIGRGDQRGAKRQSRNEDEEAPQRGAGRSASSEEHVVKNRFKSARPVEKKDNGPAAGDF